jgi:hypothetical protein
MGWEGTAPTVTGKRLSVLKSTGKQTWRVAPDQTNIHQKNKSHKDEE